MSIDYTIGDSIAATKDSLHGLFKDGNVFICKGLKIKTCCGALAVDIGLKAIASMDGCTKECNTQLKNVDGILWCNALFFRKLDHTFAEELTARIEEEINQENLVGV